MQAGEGRWHHFKGAGAWEGWGDLGLAVMLPVHSRLAMRHVYLIQKRLLIMVLLCITTHCQKHALLCIILYGSVSVCAASHWFHPRWTLRCQTCSSGCLSLLSIWVFSAGGLQVKCGCHNKAALSSACPFQAAEQLLDAPIKVWSLCPLGFCASLIFLSCHYSTAMLSVTGLAKHKQCGLLVSTLIYPSSWIWELRRTVFKSEIREALSGIRLKCVVVYWFGRTEIQLPSTDFLSFFQYW